MTARYGLVGGLLVALISLGAGDDQLKPPAVGQKAPDWQAEAWSDGKVRAPEDFRGKVVFLDFWGIWCGPCLHAMPALEQLRTKHEAKGLVFLSVHTPGDELDAIRKVLDQAKVKLPFLLDKSVGQNHKEKGGQTARSYGITMYPTVILIDRQGRIAFRSDDAKMVPSAVKIAKEELGIDLEKANAEQFREVLKVVYNHEIERAMAQPK